MAKVTPISEYFQHFLADLKETFWGDVYGQTRLAWQRFFQLESERQRDRFAGWGWYERGARKRRQYRNGYYERDFVTRFGTLRLRVARTREKSFLPRGLQPFQRRGGGGLLVVPGGVFVGGRNPPSGGGGGHLTPVGGEVGDACGNVP